MRIISYIVLCLSFCQSLLGDHGDLRSSHFIPSENWNRVDVCDWTCKNTTDDVGINSNWELNVIVSIDRAPLFTIGYDASLKVLTFIHQARHIAVAVDGNTGFVGWFNIKTGSCLVINIKNSLAIYVYNERVKNLSLVNIESALKVFAEVITSNSRAVQDGANPKSANVFDILVVVNVIYNRHDYISATLKYFKGRKNLHKEIFLNFAFWFDIVREQITNGIITEDFGIVGFFAPVFDNPNTISLGLLKLLVALYGNTSGQFGGKFAVAIYKLLSASIATDESDRVFASLIASVEAIGYLYVNLDIALAAYRSGNELVTIGRRTVIIGRQTCILVYGKNVDGSWFVTLKSKSVDVVVLYLKSLNAFVIYNRKIDIILVFSGSSGLFAVWNIKTGEGIIVRYSTGAAIIISSDSSITQSFSAGAVVHGCVAIAAKIESFKSFRYSPLDKSTFLLSTYILTVHNKGVASANVAVSSSVRAVIITSFKAYFELVAKAKASFVSGLGVLNIIFVSSGGTAAVGWSDHIREFIASIYLGKLEGKFDSQLFDEVYYEVSVNGKTIGSGSFVSKLIATIKGITNIEGGISIAVSSALKASGFIGGSLSGSVSF